MSPFDYKKLNIFKNLQLEFLCGAPVGAGEAPCQIHCRGNTGGRRMAEWVSFHYGFESFNVKRPYS